MKCVILAAGQGTRLKPLTDDKPKCLLDVGGKEILGWQLDALEKNGIKDIIIVVGYKKEMIEDYCQSYTTLNIQIVDNPDYATTNNLYSLEIALKVVNNVDKIYHEFLLLNGDVIFHRDIIKSLINSPFPNSMAVIRKQCNAEDMKVLVNSGKIIRIGKNIGPDIADGEFIGLAKFKGLERQTCARYRNSNWFEFMINEELKHYDTSYLAAIDITHYPAMEIDTHEDYDIADEIYKWGMPDWEFAIRHGSNVNKEAAFRLISDLVDEFERLNIKYWFNWGLLLGVVRDKDFIPWDNDLDITIHAKDKDLVIAEIIPAMQNKGCFCPEREVCFPEDFWFIRDMEKIELNTVETIGDKYVYAPGRCDLACPREYLKILQKIQFYGRAFMIPWNAEEYLRLSYGDDWKTPIRDKKPTTL